jgi:hypothetical protein
MNYYPPMGYQNPYGYYMPNNYQQNVTNNTQYSRQDSLQGSVVDSVEVVKAKNCNLDGSPSYYPRADKTVIYCKQLNPQTGSGVILTYKLAEDSVQEATEDSNNLSELITQLQTDVNDVKALLTEALTPKQNVQGGNRR